MTSKKRTALFGLRNFTFFFKLLFNHSELEKTFNMWKERFCSSFPTSYYMPHSDKRFRNAIKNTIHVFCAKKKRFSKLLLNRLYFAKNLSWVMILVSIAFQRYIICPTPIKFVEIMAKICFSHFQNWLKTVKNWEKQYIPKSLAFVQDFQRHIICCILTHG